MLRSVERSALPGIGDRVPTADLLAAYAAGLPADEIVHVPSILFSTPGRTVLRARPAVQDCDEALLPTVAVVIPTRDRIDLLAPCIASLKGRTDYPADRLDVIIIDNGSVEAQTQAFLAEHAGRGWFRTIRHDGAFNYAELNNRAVGVCSTEIIVFVNNDVDFIEPGWLRRIVCQAGKADVGAVGIKLICDDMTVQHEGLLVGVSGPACHAFLGLGADDPGYHGLATTDHEVSAVTGAVLAMRRDLFVAMGGFDKRLAVTYNDVVLCLDAGRRGLRNIVLNSVSALHRESLSRGVDVTSEKHARSRSEFAIARAGRKSLFAEDPFYSPNLSREEPYRLAFPPRDVRMSSRCPDGENPVRPVSTRPF